MEPTDSQSVEEAVKNLVLVGGATCNPPHRVPHSLPHLLRREVRSWATHYSGHIYCNYYTELLISLSSISTDRLVAVAADQLTGHEALQGRGLLSRGEGNGPCGGGEGQGADFDTYYTVKYIIIQ